MGRSLTRVTPATLKTLPTSGSVYIQSLERHFEVFNQNEKLFQSEYEIAPDGKDVFRNTREIEWIIGAGANGFGGITKRGDYLFEAPLSFYSKTDKWEPSPGYEQQDIGFNRPVLAGCISCHNGRARPLDQTTGKFEPVAFSQLSIGCENCHGPGAEHVRAMRMPNSAHSGSQIVNPGKLSADLENDICMSCHEAGDARVLKPGKKFDDFRPGTSLDDTFSVLMVPLKRGQTADSDHVQHYYEMSMSKCYRGSSGQLRCASCHDPHVEPSADEAAAYFNGKCLNCHASHGCTLSMAARRQTTPANSCIACHMPQREAPETAHTSLTNHRILARPGEEWPDAAYKETTAALPDLVHLNRVPGREEGVPALSLLEAYREIAERQPEYLTSFRRVLDELEQRDPDHPTVQLELGRRDLQNGDVRGAVDHFQRSLQIDPQQPLVYGYLSEALAQRGQIEEAVTASEKSVELDPYNQLLQKELIARLIAAERHKKAQEALEHYVEMFPEDSFVRQMLAIARQ